MQNSPLNIMYLLYLEQSYSWIQGGYSIQWTQIPISEPLISAISTKFEMISITIAYWGTF